MKKTTEPPPSNSTLQLTTPAERFTWLATCLVAIHARQVDPRQTADCVIEAMRARGGVPDQ